MTLVGSLEKDMKTRTFRILIIGLFLNLTIQGQEFNKNEKLWNSEDRLSESDFQLKMESAKSVPCFAMYSMNYTVNGFDFFTKNFNKKVKNIMYKNASWLSANENDKQQLIRYQQVLFDISEKHTRKFRKQLFINRKKIISGTQIIEKINGEILKEFSTERSKFENESDSGRIKPVVEKWEKRISFEIQELTEFRYENSKKIKSTE